MNDIELQVNQYVRNETFTWASESVGRKLEEKVVLTILRGVESLRGSGVDETVIRLCVESQANWPARLRSFEATNTPAQYVDWTRNFYNRFLGTSF